MTRGESAEGRWRDTSALEEAGEERASISASQRGSSTVVPDLRAWEGLLSR